MIEISKTNMIALTVLCVQNSCTMDDLILALMSNIVREQLRIQIHFNKTGAVDGYEKK